MPVRSFQDNRGFWFGDSRCVDHHRHEQFGSLVVLHRRRWVKTCRVSPHTIEPRASRALPHEPRGARNIRCGVNHRTRIDRRRLPRSCIARGVRQLPHLRLSERLLALGPGARAEGEAGALIAPGCGCVLRERETNPARRAECRSDIAGRGDAPALVVELCPASCAVEDEAATLVALER